jgi:undecaprenyl-diphosphatase
MMGLGSLRAADRQLYRLLHGRLRAGPIDPIMVAATRVGTKSAVWLAIAGVLAIFGSNRARRTALATVGATLTAQAISNVGLKPIFRRKRPFHKSKLGAVLLVKAPREHSWPSGHAASSVAAATVLRTAYPGRSTPLALLAAAVAYSRVYVGVHYPFDVLAGTVVGIAIGKVWTKASALEWHGVE